MSPFNMMMGLGLTLIGVLSALALTAIGLKTILAPILDLLTKIQSVLPK